MQTNEERREVAERLRRQARWMNKNKDWYDKDDVDQGNRAYRNIADSVEKGSNFSNHYEETVRKLADLIDRPTCHDVTDLDRESFKCLRCGYRVLSIDGAPDAAKLVSPKGGVVDFGYCPNCGAEVQE